MLRPIALPSTHMECRFLKETVPVLTDLLGFEVLAQGDKEATLKHPNTDWLLFIHEAGPEAPVKEMHNHYGVRVATNQEVDAAYEYLTAHKEQYALEQIGKPAYSHGSYSLYFLEPGTNGWEIECYENFLRVPKSETMFGGVRTPHWANRFSPERFAGRGYVPQGFTHGTLAIGNVKVSERFYRDVLGLETYQANPRVIYTKHPNSKCYIVCAERKEWKSFSPNFRFTLLLSFRDEVADAHRRLSDSGKELGVTELGELAHGGRSFVLRDPDRNCWEVSGQN
ncbi:MAG: VOC family protein [Candidatus Binatia bacterium]